VDSSSSSTAPSWTSNDVAPATAEEMKMASYLIISAAFDDFVPEVNTTVPLKLSYFLDEVKDGTVAGASLKFAKDWLHNRPMPALHQPRTCSVVIKVQPLS
jgi:phosphopantothenoylcysteine synthetase/decarboxylase